MTNDRIKAVVGFVTAEFSPLIGFLVLSWTFGLKVAIAGTPCCPLRHQQVKTRVRTTHLSRDIRHALIPARTSGLRHAALAPPHRSGAPLRRLRSVPRYRPPP